MSKFSVLFSTASLLVLSACQTTNNGWTDWEGIPKNEAILDWNQTKDASLYARKVTHSGTYQEEWVWDEGSMLITKAGHARHYRIKIDEKEFGKLMSDWHDFEKSAPKLNPSEVNVLTNQYGKFYYAELMNDKSAECITFMQAVRAATPAGYRNVPHPTGLFMGYDCGDGRFSISQIADFANTLNYGKSTATVKKVQRDDEEKNLQKRRSKDYLW
ncbi:hypothetical protein [Kiloniella litopenaei]|uniref:hypothetical protein n=1 Tax=Kiloniella litopenaei TaxID=1549748 RepID=UPI003BA8C681